MSPKSLGSGVGWEWSQPWSPNCPWDCRSRCSADVGQQMALELERQGKVPFSAEGNPDRWLRLGFLILLGMIHAEEGAQADTFAP